MYIHIITYEYIHRYTFMHIHTYTYVYTCVYTHIFIYSYSHILHAYTHVYESIIYRKRLAAPSHLQNAPQSADLSLSFRTFQTFHCALLVECAPPQ